MRPRQGARGVAAPTREKADAGASIVGDLVGRNAPKPPSASSRGHGGAAQILVPRETRKPTADYPGAAFDPKRLHGDFGKALSGTLDDVAAVTGIDPRAIPGHVKELVPGTKEYEKNHRALKPGEKPDVSLGIVPFVPGGSGIGRGLERELSIARRSRKELRLAAKQRRAVTRVDAALEQSPVRQQAHAHFDANSPTPEAAQAQKDLWDQKVRELAFQHAASPAKVKQIVEHIGGPGELLPHDLGDIHFLYQGRPPEAPVMPARIRGGAKAQQVYKLVKQGAAYRDWYQRAAWVVSLAAKKEGITYDQMAQIVAITSQGVNPTFNLRLALEAVQNYKLHGRVQIGAKAPYIFDPTEVESVLRGGTWEGRKRSSFYQNITQNTDHVTVDRHIAQMIHGTDSPSAKQYDSAEKLFRDIAAQLGWSPKEVQAAAWVPWKAQGKAAQVVERGGTAQPLESYMPASGDAYEAGWRNAVTPGRPSGSRAKAPALTANEKNRADLGYETAKGNDLEGLPTTVKYRGEEISAHSNAVAQGLAEDYMRDAGLPYDPPHTYAKVDKARAEKIAKWYDGAVDAPNDPAVRAAYDAMAQETLAQYRKITNAGYTFEFYPEGFDPYPGGPREAMLDLQQNRHMYVYPTEAGFGTEHVATQHPLLADSGLKWGEKNVTHNDVFRAVHDFFGHFKEGVGFRAEGEENAWRAHSAMYSETARPAMTSETRGQNSWVNYGPHGEANRKAMQDTTVYADQKAVLAPDWVVNDGAHDAGQIRTETGTDVPTQSFGDAASAALDEHAQAALDIARLLPEDQWPAWVKNQIRTQAVGREAPIELPNPESPLDANRGPTQRYMEFLAGKDTPDTFPGSWLSKISKIDGGLNSGIPIGFELEGERGLLQRGPYEPFHQNLNDLRQQVRKPRSRIAFNVVYKPVWKASRALQKSEWVRDTPGVRLLTSGERIVKQAGRDQRAEAGRRSAGFHSEIHTIAKVKEGSPEDVANFWYAQLPASHRNAEGLRLVIQRQRDEIEFITSGKASKELDAREAELEAEQKTADDPFDALQGLEQIKLIRSDLEGRVKDASASVASLEKIAENPPPVNADAMKAVDALMADRERILTEGDHARLKGDRAENRRGLVSRELGLEPSGEESYLGHRLATPDATGAYSAPSGGVGKVKTPKGVGSPNHFVLGRTGRLRQTLHVALEDWHSAQVFEQANIARNDLAKAGTKFDGHVPVGHMLVNPKGRTVPAHWKNDELAQFPDGYEDTEILRKRAQEVVDGFIADGADAEAITNLKRSALEDGVQWDELRVVPSRYVERYYKQFKSSGRSNVASKAYDAMVDGVVTSIVFARIGYIPKNFTQNVIMAVPHQGPMLLVNATRAAQALADPELRALIHAEIGHSGPMAGLEREGVSNLPNKVLGKVAGFVGKSADDPARFSAFLHEAAAEGVISRINPFLTEKDAAALKDLLKNPKQRELLNDVRARATEAMADFTRMTPDQAKQARRLLIIPGWLVAGSRYPFHFAVNHPVRSALMAYIAMGEPGAPDNLQFNKPLDEYFTHGVPSFLQGIPIAGKVFRTGSLSPVGTPWELAQAAKETATGKSPYDFFTSTAFDYANPLVGAGTEFAQGGGVRSLERLVPNEKFIRGMISPKASTTYPEDATRMGRLKREIGVIPIEIGANPGGRKKSKSAMDKAHEREAQIKKTFGNLPPAIKAAVESKAIYHDYLIAWKKEQGITKTTDRQQTEAKIHVLEQTNPQMAHQLSAYLTQVGGQAEWLTEINGFVEQALKWDQVDAYMAQVHDQQKLQKAAHGG